MVSVLERAARVIPVQVITHLFPENALVPPAPAPAGTSAAAPSPRPSTTPSVSEIFVQAVGSHLRGLITEPDVKAEIAAVISECGFEAGALERLSAMEVAPHLGEVTEVGRSIRHRLFGFNDEGLRARVQHSMAAPSEQIELMLDVATVFLMAAIGDGSRTRAAPGSGTPTLDETLLSLGLPSPDSGGLGATPARSTRSAFSAPSNTTSTSRPVTLARADSSPEDVGNSIPVLGAEVPEFMRWAPPDEQLTRGSASGVKFRWVIAPLALGAMGYLLGTSDSVQTWVRFTLSDTEELVAESDLAPRTRRRLARLNSQNDVGQSENALQAATSNEAVQNLTEPGMTAIGERAGAAALIADAIPPVMDHAVIGELASAPPAAAPAAREAFPLPEPLMMASETFQDPARAKLSLEQLEPVSETQAVESVQDNRIGVSPLTASTREQDRARAPSSEPPTIQELSALLSGRHKLSPENSTWALPEISFESGRKDPVGASEEFFKQLAWLLEAHPRARIEISVPTLLRGSENAASIALTQVRAEQLKIKLLAAGASKTRIDTRARANSELSGDTRSETQGLVALRLLRR